MNFESKINTLKNVVEKVSRATGKNLSLPVLSCVIFDVDKVKNVLTVKSTNLDIAAQISIPIKASESGSVAVPAQTILNFLSSISYDGDIKFSQKGENLLVSFKNNTSTIKCLPKDDFPEIPTVSVIKECKILSKDFVNGIKSVWFSASISSIKPELASIFIYSGNQELIFVATDSFRLAEKKVSFKNPTEFQQVLIPYKNIPDILKILEGFTGELDIVFDKNQIQIGFDRTRIVSRIVDATFPDYKQIIPKDLKIEAIVLKADLLKAIKGAQVFTDNFNQIRLNFNQKDGNIKISAKNSDVGDYNESIQAKISGSDLEIAFNYKYVLDSLQSIDSESLNLSLAGPGRPMIMASSGDKSFMYIVMPMNK